MRRSRCEKNANGETVMNDAREMDAARMKWYTNVEWMGPDVLGEIGRLNIEASTVNQVGEKFEFPQLGHTVNV